LNHEGTKDAKEDEEEKWTILLSFFVLFVSTWFDIPVQHQ
jgi:hypothetical protein